MSATRHFDADYQEHVTLADGSEALLRLVRPTDKDLFVEGLKRLSDESRYLRFFAPKTHLTAKELAYLTEVDGEDHLAIGAAREGEDGNQRGLGVARVIRCFDSPQVAEAAIVVVDEVQGQGLGRVLFLRLAAAARERDIELFRSELLAANRKMRALIHELAPGSKEHVDRGIITVESSVPDVLVDVPREHPSGRETNYRLLTLAAERSLRLRPPPLPPKGSCGER